MIGPGRLVLVVGPSGAGKDTLIAGSKASLAGNPSVVFPRRVVTRSSSPAEDHDTLDPAAFDAAAAHGDFGFWWEAHGLKYGIPQAIDGDLAAGRTAVCNVSRMIIADARARYARGLTDFLVELDAERTWIQARRDLSDSNHQLFVRLIAVYKAVGGGDAGELQGAAAATPGAAAPATPPKAPNQSGS